MWPIDEPRECNLFKIRHINRKKSVTEKQSVNACSLQPIFITHDNKRYLNSRTCSSAAWCNTAMQTLSAKSRWRFRWSSSICTHCSRNTALVPRPVCHHVKTQCVTGPHKCTCQMASKSAEWFKQGARMWQTDRPHYGEMCSYRQNRLLFAHALFAVCTYMWNVKPNSLTHSLTGQRVIKLTC